MCAYTVYVYTYRLYICVCVLVMYVCVYMSVPDGVCMIVSLHSPACSCTHVRLLWWHEVHLSCLSLRPSVDKLLSYVQVLLQLD